MSGVRLSRPDGLGRRRPPAFGWTLITRVLVALPIVTLGGCVGDPADELAERIPAFASDNEDYCAITELELPVLADRPGGDAAPIDDVNWFARPLLHDGTDWIIAFASHDQNYIYNLTTDRRVAIPDRSDAVATPDGRYMTVPSNYTPDSNIRFYPVAPMLAALESGDDVPDLEPAFIHEHATLKSVYYQSTALVSETDTDSGLETVYRLMFSGGSDESNFRIADYLFRHNADSGELLAVTPSEPMAICPEVQNDLNTPFISKDGRYVAAYTSETAGNTYTGGSSLKVFEITSTDPAAGTTTCVEVADLGFAAGKADFSFDNSMLTFHLSQGAYLTPFVNGGLPAGTITDVMVARLDQDASGRITGASGLQRLSTSLESGVGSYFPAFFPDGKLFFLSNAVPRGTENGKRFHFRVVDPSSRGWRTAAVTDPAHLTAWSELSSFWQSACTPRLSGLEADPFPLDDHELPLAAMALTPRQCGALVQDMQAEASASTTDWAGLTELCYAIEP